MIEYTKEYTDWIEKYIRDNIHGIFTDQNGKMFVSYYLFPDGTSDIYLYLEKYPEEWDNVFSGKYKMKKEIPYPPEKIYIDHYNKIEFNI